MTNARKTRGEPKKDLELVTMPIHMIVLKIVLGIIALFVAWAILFRQHLIYTVNRWMREYAFSDQWVLFSGRRIAVLLLILGGLAIFSGLDTVTSKKTIVVPIIADIMVQIKQEYKAKNYLLVVNRCQAIKKIDPNNLEAREYLAASWFSLDEGDKAKREIETILKINPNYNFNKGPLTKFFLKK